GLLRFAGGDLAGIGAAKAAVAAVGAQIRFAAVDLAGAAEAGVDVAVVRDVVNQPRVAVPQLVGIIVIGNGAAAGDGVAVVEVVEAQAREQRPPLAEIDGIHQVHRQGIHPPVGIPGALADFPAEQVVDVGQGVAVAIGEAITRRDAAATGHPAVGGTAVDHIVDTVEHFVLGIFGADHELVLHAGDLRVQVQVGLVDEVVHFLPALVGAGGEGGGARGDGVGGIAGGAPGAGHHVAVVGGAEAGGVFQANIVGKVVAGAKGEYLDVGFHEVLLLEVDGSVLHGPAVGQDVGAEVRFVGGIHVVVIRHQIEVVADLPEGGECRPLALCGGGAAGGFMLVGVRQVGAHREFVGDALVAVLAVALVAVGAEADLRLVEVVLGAGPLGDAVHPAAGGTAPGEGGAGALGDFDLFHREAFPGGHARVPQAVDEYVAAGLVAADDVAVAEGVAVLAGAEGDA